MTLPLAGIDGAHDGGRDASCARIGLARQWALVASVLIFAGGLLCPLAFVASHGWTLTGMYEESVGYRYFDSLRLMYSPSEYVFLPQGQIVDIVNQDIQMALTDLGYPPTVLFPRIDLFTYAAVAVGHLMAVGVFAWTVAPLGNWIGKLFAAAFWLSLYFLLAMTGAHAILQPDYHIWMLSVGLATAGAFVRWSTDASPWRFREAVALGLLGGLAAGIKLTLLVFPLTFGLAWLVTKREGLRSLTMGLSAAAIALLTWLMIVMLCYHADVSHFSRFFPQLRYYMSTLQKPAASYPVWLAASFTHTPWIVRLAIALPLVLLGAALALRKTPHGRIAAALAVGAALTHWWLYSRFVSATWLEAIVFLQMATWYVAGAGILKVKVLPRYVVGVGGLVGLVVILTLGVGPAASQVGNVGANDAATRALWRMLGTARAPIAFLIPEDRFRPLSVDSAIFKGGSLLMDGRYTSPLVRHIVPGREYFTTTTDEDRQHPLRLGDFPTVVFATWDLDRTHRRTDVVHLEAIYATSLRVFACDRDVDFVYQLVVVCTRRVE